MKRTWKKLKAGDKVVLYNSGKYAYLGIVLTKIKDEDLAKAVWPQVKLGDPIFKYIYFLVDVQKIDISPIDFNQLFDYEMGYSPQSFGAISKERIYFATDTHGSVENCPKQNIVCVAESSMMNIKIN